MQSDAKIPAIEKAAWQPLLFTAAPRRSEILALKPDWLCRRINLRVHRNMPFEFIAGILGPFLAFADLEAAISLSDYDDSLQSCAAKAEADCQLIWLDYSRYATKLNDKELCSWLKERLQALRAVSDAPILIADDLGMSQSFNDELGEIVATIPDARIFPRHTLQSELGAKWTDTRMKNVGASTMSDEAIVATARLLGLAWIPAAVGTGLKAVVLDLDQTLYAGVLGEDGISGVVLSPAYTAFQEKILALKERGIFLALLSRNERSDVEELFTARTDFPLQWKDFSAVSIGWNDKSQGLRDIATQLRIDPDAMLVIDDNLGEIAEMALRYPATAFWHAADPLLGIRALDLFPRLLRWQRSQSDQLRARDLEASHSRSKLMEQAQDPATYVRSLGITLNFRLDPTDLRERLAELANKTNQFVLSLARFREAEVACRLSDAHSATIAVSLADRLSDSGVIAAIFCHAENRTLIVDEICISCRALGRHMEDVMIIHALDRARQKLAADKVSFCYNRGPRNDPARKWLETITGTPLPTEQGQLVVEWKILQDKLPDLPVTIVHDYEEQAA